MEQEQKKLTTNKGNVSKALLFFLFVALVVVTYLYVTKNRELTLIKDPNAQAAYAQKLNKEAVAELRKYVVVAEGEEPVLLAVVGDPEILKTEQAFFANVQTGDQIFVFQQSSRALVWRPESKMVVNFGMLDIQENKGPAPETKSVEKAPAKK